MSEGPRFPKGYYRARAVDGGLGHTEKGREQVAVQFEMLDDEWKGNTITWFGYFDDRIVTKNNLSLTDLTLQALRNAGWTCDDLSVLEGLGSTEVSLSIEHDEYEGKVRSKVAWVNKPGGGLMIKAPMKESDAKAFAARMKRKAQASRPAPEANGAKAAAHVNAPGSSVNPPVNSDDIPF